MKCAGIWSAMPTPLNRDKTVDAGSVERLVEHQIKLGIQGLFICGTAGEGPWLSDTERRRLALATVKAVNGRIPVTMQLTDNSAPRMIENARRYQDTGVDLFVFAPPFFQRAWTQDYLCAMYEEIVEANPLPSGIYNRGRYSDVLIEPDTLAKIIAHPKVVLVKDSGGPEYVEAVLNVRNRRRGELWALSGDEFDCVTYLEKGYDGLMLGGACFHGAMTAEIARLVQAGDRGAAVALQARMNSMMHKVFGGEKFSCWLAGQKELLRRLGIIDCAETLLAFQLSDECAAGIAEVLITEKAYLEQA